MFDRRRFLNALTASMTAVVQPVWAASDLLDRPAPGAGIRTGGVPQRETLTRLVGETFRMRYDGRETPVLLAAIRDENCCGMLDQFSLDFICAGKTLDEAFYQLEHATTGRFSLLLTPCLNPDKSQTMTALFSLLRGG